MKKIVIFIILLFMFSGCSNTVVKAKPEKTQAFINKLPGEYLLIQGVVSNKIKIKKLNENLYEVDLSIESLHYKNEQIKQIIEVLGVNKQGDKYFLDFKEPKNTEKINSKSKTKGYKLHAMRLIKIKNDILGGIVVIFSNSESKSSYVIGGIKIK